MKFFKPLSPIQRNTLLIFVAIGILKIVGFLRDIVLANFFGVNRTVDVYYYSMIVPFVLLVIFSAGFNAFFIPTYIKIKFLWGKQKAQDYCSNFIIYAVVPLTLITFICGWMIPKGLVSVNPPFFQSKEEIQTFLLFSKWFAFFFFLSNLTNFFSSLFQAEHYYAYSFYPQLIIPVSTIVFIIFGHKHDGITAAVYGLICGAFLSFLCSFLISVRTGLFFILPHKISLKEITYNIDQLGFSTMSVVLPSLIVGIDQYMAGHLGEGKLTSLIYGIRIPDGFSEIIGMGLGVAAFSHFSQWAVTQDRQSMIRATQRILIYATLFVVPLCFYLIIYSEQLIRFLFERGAFSVEATEQVSIVLRYYALNSFLFIISVIGMRLLSALHKNHIILILSLVGFILKISLNLLFIQWFGLTGIPLATMGMYLISISLIYYFLTKLGLHILLNPFVKRMTIACLFSLMVIPCLIGILQISNEFNGFGKLFLGG